MKHLILVILLFCAFAPRAKADVQPDLNAFGAWPVLHEGRIKTMESFARSVFFDVTGHKTLNDVTALEWLVNSLFDPSSTINDPYIYVPRNTILDVPDSYQYHSMTAVMQALNPHEEMILTLERRDPAEYSASQVNLMKTYRAVSLYNQIIQSFSAVLPLKGGEALSFVEGGGDQMRRELIIAGGRENGLLKFIDSGNPSMPKISVWEALGAGVENDIVPEIKMMARAWNEGNYTLWNEKANEVKNTLQATTAYSWTLTLEHVYVTMQPLLWALGFYSVSIIVFYWSPKLAMMMIAAGFLLHIGALLARSLILMRPPTGTLYETLLFGPAVIMMVGLILYLVNRKNALFALICAASSAFLLFVSRGLIQGDSLNVLVAVLNTNFWLSTHVTCIIIGYGFCIMMAMVAHYNLAFENAQIKKLLLPLALASLLFTAIGTLLGGIWADQSWGRFWGWDPKENGALLIVLWLSWALHGRISGHFKDRAFNAVLALTNIMVALTWFGVNLLGVGLHSYGFISGIATGLAVFIIGQLVVVAVLYYWQPKRQQVPVNG